MPEQPKARGLRALFSPEERCAEQVRVSVRGLVEFTLHGEDIYPSGGSLRDTEVIMACNEADPQVAMVFTGQRSFRH